MMPLLYPTLDIQLMETIWIMTLLYPTWDIQPMETLCMNDGIVVPHVRYTVNGSDMNDATVVFHVRYTTNGNDMNNAFVVYHITYTTNRSNCIRLAYMCILAIVRWWFLCTLLSLSFVTKRFFGTDKIIVSHDTLLFLIWYSSTRSMYVKLSN